MASKPLFSRSGYTGPLGKCDDRMEAFRIEGVVKARFAARAAAMGKTAAELNRDILRVLELGSEELRSMHSSYVDVVVGMLDTVFGNKR